MSEYNRLGFIKHYKEIQRKDEAHYPGSDELLGMGSPFSKAFGLQKIGIWHMELPPGRRTSYPHAESDEEEFVYVISGNPDVWIDGVLHSLSPGDGVGFPSGTGICHTFINNTKIHVHLIVVGESNKSTNRIFYPLNPERKEDCKDCWWEDVPYNKKGNHNGKVSI